MNTKVCGRKQPSALFTVCLVFFYVVSGTPQREEPVTLSSFGNEISIS
jgi:hypothetical protein